LPYSLFIWKKLALKPLTVLDYCNKKYNNHSRLATFKFKKLQVGVKQKKEKKIE